MARERDSQRRRVYDAEHRAFGWWYSPKSELMTIEQCQAFIDKMLASEWLRKQTDLGVGFLRRTGVTVIPGRGGANAAFDDRYGTAYGFITRTTKGPSISVGVQARQPFILIHELTHLLHPSQAHAAHGWKFCEIELRLVRHFLGKEAHDKLKAEFKAGKVRFTKPRAKRELTPEQKAVLIERMAKARAAKVEIAVPSCSECGTGQCPFFYEKTACPSYESASKVA
jgi:putative metallohydrolase (TIGR04338 family)